MSDLKSKLGDPVKLAAARAVAHAAVQPLSKAARANLAAVPDDSHSNIGWSSDGAMFLTHPIDAGGQSVTVGLSLDPLRLIVLQGSAAVNDLPFAGQSLAEAEAWLDRRLGELGLSPASPVNLPYTLPEDATEIAIFPTYTPGLDALAAWYTLAADALEAVAADITDLKPGPSDVRCWPHHFDIATYVDLEERDFETAKGIGIGLSPGDESYAEPYFYVNPWPHLDTATLPAPVAPGHWHTTGFVGAIATASKMLGLDDPAAGTLSFLRGSFALGRGGLGL